MILDANAFKKQLSPEAAIGMVQKTALSRGWKKVEVQQIKLVYSPYYIFSFDVSPEGGQPVSGKTALNAFTGELSDFVPVLLDSPLSKNRDTGDSAGEVEPTSISQFEAKQAAQAKVAAQLSVKRDDVAISAVSKFYVPFYRIWANLPAGQFKIDVDGCLGTPTGLENIPLRQKTFDEDTAETFEKMKSPGGWIDLFGRIFSASKTAAGGGAGKPGLPKQAIWAILIGAILLFFLFGSAPKTDFSCALDSDFVQEKTVMFFSKETRITPQPVVENFSRIYVEGTCTFSNKEQREQSFFACQKIAYKNGTLIANNNSFALLQPFDPKGGKQDVEKSFRLEWEDPGVPVEYRFEYGKTC